MTGPTDPPGRPALLVVLSSTRPARLGDKVAAWVVEAARRWTTMDVSVADLREMDLPFLDEPRHPRLGEYEHAHTQGWSARVRAADAVVLVFPEYNHSFPAPLKNALDFLYQEWADKPVGLVSYGGAAGGSRAATALEPVLSHLRMDLVPRRVEIEAVRDRVDSEALDASAAHQAALRTLLSQVEQRAG